VLHSIYPYEIGTWAELPFVCIWQYIGRQLLLDEHCPKIHTLKDHHMLKWIHYTMELLQTTQFHNTLYSSPWNLCH